MTGAQIRTLLVRLDKIGWLMLISWFVIGVAVPFYEPDLASRVGASGIWLVLVLTIFRLVLVAEQFREKGEKKYRLLGYTLLLVLFASMGAHYFLG